MQASTEAWFHSEMTVEHALTLHPGARWVMAAYHLGGCSTCAESSAETLAQVAAGYGLSLEKLVADLNSLFAAG